MKKTLIFDLDGTLWDSTKQISTVWKKIANSYNINFNEIPINDLMGLTTNEIIEKLFHNNYELGNQYINEFQEKEVEYLSIHGGNIYTNTISTIKELAKKFNLFIVSNCQKGYIESFLSYYNLTQFFKDFECSGNTNLSKAENIQLLMKRNNIKNSIYVGDTSGDFFSAKKSNNKFIWAKYGFGICENYDYCISDISELLNILNNI